MCLRRDENVLLDYVFTVVLKNEMKNLIAFPVEANDIYSKRKME